MGAPTRITLLERVRATRSGDSWAEFVEVYDGLVYGWLRRQGVSDADADDIRQEVMTTVVQEIGRFEHNGRPGAFRNWMRQITVNRMRRFWRNKSRRSAANAGPDVDALASQLEDASSRLTLVWEADHNRFVLARLLGMLAGRFSDKSLAVFRRIAIEEEPAADVAEDLGMTLGAARVAQHRVLRALRELGAGLID